VNRNQSYRTQKISYPVLQLLKSIQQEKEYINILSSIEIFILPLKEKISIISLFRLAQHLSQSSAQATFSNVNPSQSLPYASPIHTQLGKQTNATHRHPKCILHLDGNIFVLVLFKYILYFRSIYFG